MDILFLVSRVPYPLEKGDKLRAFHQLRLLSKRHSIALVALTDQPLHPDARSVLQRYCSSIHIIQLPWGERLLQLATALFKGIPFSSAYFFNWNAQSVIDRTIEQLRPAHIYGQLTRVCEYLKDVNGIPKTLDFQDAFATGMEKRIKRESPLLRWLFRMEHVRLQRYEARMLDCFDSCTIISEQDRDCIDHPHRDRIVIVPNGVDLEYFQSRQIAKDYDLVFTGNMAYPPNVEGVRFLVQKALPLVWRELPNVKLLIAGATPAARVRALESQNVHVSGWVEDIRECYDRSRLFVAPMLISIGLQNKLLEAMAMRLPCITSELSNNALRAVPGDSVIVCSTPEEYAEAIVRLLRDPGEAARLSTAGHEFVKENYSWEKMSQPLLDLIERR